ncbi:unnamed protein product [Zymoseptoria tritici ST99CH_3D7]|uniref:Uncharacterized protein n=1 Tax=Zymoseptoria tritici (strain ST99CH_3D7) TaxID=1276538 RepID=A0A1X7RXT6_ZYMT9|nr:unnamed protein product [Zymoseptoria tritici ST99CH_3D7]
MNAKIPKHFEFFKHTAASSFQPSSSCSRPLLRHASPSIASFCFRASTLGATQTAVSTNATSIWCASERAGPRRTTKSTDIGRRADEFVSPAYASAEV